MVKRYMKGLNPIRSNALYHKGFTSIIEMSKADFDRCDSSSWFILDGDKVRLKTHAELRVDADALEKKEAKKAAKENRDEALYNCNIELNGNVFQTRPSDEPNFRLRIQGMEPATSTKWLLDNDTSAVVTKEDLEKVLFLGLQAVGKIWDDYISALDAL